MVAFFDQTKVFLSMNLHEATICVHFIKTKIIHCINLFEIDAAMTVAF